MNYKLLLCLPLFAATTGCASIARGQTQGVVIDSTVPQSRFEVRNDVTQAVELTGQTPATVNLKRGAGYFKKARYTVTVSKDGYETQSFPIIASVNGWYAGGNLLVGGLIGYLAVDPATGAMWDLSPDRVNPSLVALPPPPAPVAAAETMPAAPAPEAPVEVAVATTALPLPEPGAVTAAGATAPEPEPFVEPALKPVAAPAPTLAPGGQARLLGPARTRAALEGVPVKGLGTGTTVTLKVVLKNATGAWWYVNGAAASGWVRDSELAPEAPATASGV